MKPGAFEILVDGVAVPAEEGMTVAAALWNAGRFALRKSVLGEPRGPLCAMGICFECRVTIEDADHRRACVETCRPGLKVRTGA